MSNKAIFLGRDKAIRDYNIDLSQNFAIGDKPRDCAICEVTECQGRTDLLGAAREITGKEITGKSR